jgi:hypothetical protein
MKNEKEIEQEKTTEINQESSEKSRKNITTTLLDSMIRTITELDNYKDFLSEYVNNPFFITSVSNVINFKVELEKPIKIPFYLGIFAFGENVGVNSIAVKGDSIILWYSNGSTTERYTIDLSTERLPLMDIMILLYVLSNLSMNDISMFLSNLKGFKESIQKEKSELIKILKDYGIEINY